jgi:hypothetical protein
MEGWLYYLRIISRRCSVMLGLGGKLIMGSDAPSLYDFSSFTFESNITGPNGPSLAGLRSYYNTATNPWLNDTQYFNVSNGIQQWTAPSSGRYRVVAVGGTGGIHGGSYSPAFPGAGAIVQGDVSLNEGDIINIVVGQKPSSVTSSSGNGSGGGGGTFVYTGSVGGSGLLFVAGGGGGTGHGNTSTTGGNGKGGNSATTSNESAYNELFGINARRGAGSAGNFGVGYGGRGTTTSTYGGSGGGTGWLGNGGSNTSGGNSGGGGSRFTGGTSSDGTPMYGGFGGGGGSDGGGNAGAGGGGYTGGGAGQGYTDVSGGKSWGGGAGGGSYVISSASNVSTTTGDSGINYASTGNGYVTITKL